MMTSSNGKHFPRYWPFVRGIHRSPVNSPHKGQWRGALMFSLISARINGWVNNGEAGDLRRHRAHYGIIVMSPTYCAGTKSIAIDLFTMTDRMGIGFDSESDTYNNHHFLWLRNKPLHDFGIPRAQQSTIRCTKYSLQFISTVGRYISLSLEELLPVYGTFPSLNIIPLRGLMLRPAGPLFTPLNPLYSLMGAGVGRAPLRTGHFQRHALERWTDRSEIRY